MNRIVFPVIAGILLIGVTFGSSEAEVVTPFGYNTNGLEITGYDLDFKNIEVLLDVKTSQLPATLEITFEREFFDSKKLNQDLEFTILADGEMVYYKEITSNTNYRTIEFNLTSEVELVEIFGTHLNGFTYQAPIVKVTESIPAPIMVEDTEKIKVLQKEIEELKTENKFLKEENKRLDGRIFELENLVSALEIQVNNLNSIVTEQVKVIYNWVLGNSI